jgi:methylmalonyl-CoA mutase N-terminal domain/subunit
VRSRRDGGAVERALSALEEAARGTDPLMPRIIDAVEAYASIGEIAGRLVRVFGEYREAVTL